MRRVPAILLLCVITLPIGAAEYVESDAVVIQISEDDLNRIVRDAFYANGGPVFAGTKPRVSRSVRGLQYRARLSVPRLQLAAAGDASLSFEIQEAELLIESLERKLIGRRVRCENTRATLRADHALAVSLDLSFEAGPDGLRIVPRAAASPGSQHAFDLEKPTRCRKNLLPKWLLWWIGKPHLRRHLGKLDETLLKQARRSAEELSQGEGLLHERYRSDSAELHVFPQSVDTSADALRLRLAAATSAVAPPLASAAPAWRDTGSHVAVSEGLLNALLELMFDDVSERPSRPSGNFRRLFKSDAILVLIPGLRAIDSPAGLYFKFRFAAAPRVEFHTVRHDLVDVEPGAERRGSVEAAERPLITLQISRVDADVWQEQQAGDRRLGTLSIDHGTVSVVPFVNRRGGVSFALVENEWRLSSDGIAFDEPLLAATIQELVFGELFETRYQPLQRDGWTVGKTRLEPRRFAVHDGYLVVNLAVPQPPAAPTPVAMQTNSLPASR